MATSTIRHPAVAGQFYPRDIAALRKELASYLLPDVHPTHAFGCIVPHAGYMYSGHVAGAVYSQIEIPRNCVLLCPNHTGVGRALSMVADGVWETPLGSVPVYAELASALRDECPLLYDDPGAHRSEHAIEVQLPFLQIRRSDFRFVPIAVGTSQLDDLRVLGHALGEVLAARGEPTLILASSDMNHYESDQVTRLKDHKALDQILALDPAGLYDVVMNENISMCGYGPAIVMLIATRRLGASRAELIKYATSGDVSGDRRTVVGYAGVAVR
jgi:AmmeMemoRadiSam system protein B